MPDAIETALAFDFGMKVMGVAVGQTITQSANALDTLKAIKGEPNWEQVHELIRTWHVQALVVGIPENLNQKNQHIEQAARHFALTLKQHTNLPVFTVNEQYTSTSAKSLVRNNARKAPQRLDSIAAKIILESWLNNPRGTPL